MEAHRLNNNTGSWVLLYSSNKDAIQKGEISLTDGNVSDFLDLVEGRLFNDDLTGEGRRADAYSPRKP